MGMMGEPKNIIWRWKPEGEFPINWDVAEEYIIERRPEACSGIIEWGKYRGKWHANPGTSRPIVAELLRRAGLISLSDAGVCPSYQDLIDHIRWTQNLWRHGIEIMRKNNLVIASDTPMGKLAFTFYSDLCEIDWRALHLFGEGPGDENYKDQTAIQARGIAPYPRPYEEEIKRTAEINGKKKVLTGLLCAMNDPRLTICDTGYLEHAYWTNYIRKLLSVLDADNAKESSHGK